MLVDLLFGDATGFELLLQVLMQLVQALLDLVQLVTLNVDPPLMQLCQCSFEVPSSVVFANRPVFQTFPEFAMYRLDE